MVHATKFLLRWLYLNNLIHDRAEIQSLPLLHPSQVDPQLRHQQQQIQHQQQYNNNHEYPGPEQQQQNQQNLQHQGDNFQNGQLYDNQQQQPPPSQPFNNPSYQQHHQQQYPPQPPPPLNHHHNNHQQHNQSQSTPHKKQQHPNNNLIKNDIEWKRQALCKIALYPPGTSRLLALDSLRMEIVHQLAHELHYADDIIQAYNCNNDLNDNDDNNYNSDEDIEEEDDVENEEDIDEDYKNNYDNNVDNEKSPDQKLDQDDDEIINLDTIKESENEHDLQNKKHSKVNDSILSGSSSSSSSSSSSTSKSTTGKTEEGPLILDPKLKQALELQRETREYLPQFVSAILHSPSSLTNNNNQYYNNQYYPNHHHYQQQQQNLLDPITTLRNLLINRCVKDPNFGIELCWLLEAEVGRTWKQLFEHKQQTGKRLILLLPADKALVVAKIGMDKKNAFDLLQDVECATAYGVGVDELYMNHEGGGGYNDGYYDSQQQQQGINGGYDTGKTSTTTPPLPESLSMKRCSHFGDTMHFIDRLTQISLKLRHIPVHHRTYHLQESLEELNRRLRRRMITEGHVSLDVEDHLGAYDWPSLNDITSIESLKYSVHLPLEPTATTWPGKDGFDKVKESSPLLALKTEHGVMRILNIVSSKCRLLASRERCPFLVHCEVLETGYEGSDARLYANGGDGNDDDDHDTDLGTTVQEALGVVGSSGVPGEGGKDVNEAFPPYHIPSELSSNTEQIYDNTQQMINQRSQQKQQQQQQQQPQQYGYNGEVSNDDRTMMMLRGGDQEGYPYSNINMDNNGYSSSSPYDVVQEEQLQQLHEHFQSNQHHPHYAPQQSNYYPNEVQDGPQPTTYSALLDRVFGSPWTETCEEIRKTSPYGNVKGWRLASFIMKAGEDIRREALVMQVISKMKQWFEQDIPEQNRPYLKPYTILCVGGDAGLLECIRDAKSVDEVKKQADGFTTLRDYFERAYGPPLKRGRGIHQSSAMYHQQQQQQGHYPNQPQQPPQFQQPMNPSQHPNLHQTMHNMQNQLHHQHQHQQQILDQPILNENASTNVITFEKAQDNFLRSLVGYSLICYILQIKDRHNANILLDREGHIMHIDFGFVLGDTPKMGKVPLFSERAPFKLTAEFWDVIGGWNFNHGGLGVKFCKMFEEAFYCAAMHAEELVTLIEAAILNLTQNHNVARLVANGVRNRLRMRGERNSVQQKTFIMDLVNTALTSWGTSTYDWLQKSMNGYI